VKITANSGTQAHEAWLRTRLVQEFRNEVLGALRTRLRQESDDAKKHGEAGLTDQEITDTVGKAEQHFNDKNAGWTEFDVVAKVISESYEKNFLGGAYKPRSVDDPTGGMLYRFDCILGLQWPEASETSCDIYVPELPQADLDTWKGGGSAEWQRFANADEAHEGHHANHMRKNYDAMKKAGKLPKEVTGHGVNYWYSAAEARRDAKRIALEEKRKAEQKVISDLYAAEEKYDEATGHGSGEGSPTPIPAWPR